MKFFSILAIFNVFYLSIASSLKNVLLQNDSYVNFNYDFCKGMNIHFLISAEQMQNKIFLDKLLLLIIGTAHYMRPNRKNFFGVSVYEENIVYENIEKLDKLHTPTFIETIKSVLKNYVTSEAKKTNLYSAIKDYYERNILSNPALKQAKNVIIISKKITPNDLSDYSDELINYIREIRSKDLGIFFFTSDNPFSRNTIHTLSDSRYDHEVDYPIAYFIDEQYDYKSVSGIKKFCYHLKHGAVCSRYNDWSEWSGPCEFRKRERFIPLKMTISKSTSFRLYYEPTCRRVFDFTTAIKEDYRVECNNPIYECRGICDKGYKFKPYVQYGEIVENYVECHDLPPCTPEQKEKGDNLLFTEILSNLLEDTRLREANEGLLRRQIEQDMEGETEEGSNARRIAEIRKQVDRKIRLMIERQKELLRKHKKLINKRNKKSGENDDEDEDEDENKNEERYSEGTEEKDIDKIKESESYNLNNERVDQIPNSNLISTRENSNKTPLINTNNDHAKQINEHTVPGNVDDQVNIHNKDTFNMNSRVNQNETSDYQNSLKIGSQVNDHISSEPHHNINKLKNEAHEKKISEKENENSHYNKSQEYQISAENKIKDQGEDSRINEEDEQLEKEINKERDIENGRKNDDLRIIQENEGKSGNLIKQDQIEIKMPIKESKKNYLRRGKENIDDKRIKEDQIEGEKVEQKLPFENMEISQLSDKGIDKNTLYRKEGNGYRLVGKWIDGHYIPGEWVSGYQPPNGMGREDYKEEYDKKNINVKPPLLYHAINNDLDQVEHIIQYKIPSKDITNEHQISNDNKNEKYPEYSKTIKGHYLPSEHISVDLPEEKINGNQLNKEESIKSIIGKAVSGDQTKNHILTNEHQATSSNMSGKNLSSETIRENNIPEQNIEDVIEREITSDDQAKNQKFNNEHQATSSNINGEDKSSEAIREHSIPEQNIEDDIEREITSDDQTNNQKLTNEHQATSSNMNGENQSSETIREHIIPEQNIEDDIEREITSDNQTNNQKLTNEYQATSSNMNGENQSSEVIREHIIPEQNIEDDIEREIISDDQTKSQILTNEHQATSSNISGEIQSSETIKEHNSSHENIDDDIEGEITSDDKTKSQIMTNEHQTTSSNMGGENQSTEIIREHIIPEQNIEDDIEREITSDNQKTNNQILTNEQSEVENEAERKVKLYDKPRNNDGEHIVEPSGKIKENSDSIFTKDIEDTSEGDSNKLKLEKEHAGKKNINNLIDNVIKDYNGSNNDKGINDNINEKLETLSNYVEHTKVEPNAKNKFRYKYYTSTKSIHKLLFKKSDDGKLEPNKFIVVGQNNFIIDSSDVKNPLPKKMSGEVHKILEEQLQKDIEQTLKGYEKKSENEKEKVRFNYYKAVKYAGMSALAGTIIALGAMYYFKKYHSSYIEEDEHLNNLEFQGNSEILLSDEKGKDVIGGEIGYNDESWS
ncbi:TRAP-like protein, putative [Plasmodium relictum]|uniref:TRAP-like protein, putative n=1 Tax=Plasmodium relictum TaxID=85471 RepID=A0A1J1H986_PLARL|nr:TRAP-like protein, putative [Plasmodium relictum]CRH01500.1 TRAP-like protein, putative [Plasmodium relictum]